MTPKSGNPSQACHPKTKCFVVNKNEDLTTCIFSLKSEWRRCHWSWPNFSVHSGPNEVPAFKRAPFLHLQRKKGGAKISARPFQCGWVRSKPSPGSVHCAASFLFTFISNRFVHSDLVLPKRDGSTLSLAMPRAQRKL